LPIANAMGFTRTTLGSTALRAKAEGANDEAHGIEQWLARGIEQWLARGIEQWLAFSTMGGISRAYRAEDVHSLRGTVRVEHSLARTGAEKLWRLLQEESYVPALGALTGNQAVQMAQAGLKAIYLSGWQVAADANLSGQMYPDQSLYPVNSVPAVVRGINNALMRADQIAHAEGSRASTGCCPSLPMPRLDSAAC